MQELRAGLLSPVSRLYPGEEHLGITDDGLHFRNIQPVRQRHGLTVKLSSAYDEHFLRTWSRGLSFGQSLFQSAAELRLTAFRKVPQNSASQPSGAV